MKDLRGDIRDRKRVQELIQEEKPEIVFNLAAQALVIDGYKDPLGTYDTNVGGTLNLLEAIRTTNSVKVAVFVTTDKVYENKEWLWPYRETEALGGFDPYSSSKGASELVINAYRNSFFETETPSLKGKTSPVFLQLEQEMSLVEETGASIELFRIASIRCKMKKP